MAVESSLPSMESSVLMHNIERIVQACAESTHSLLSCIYAIRFLIFVPSVCLIFIGKRKTEERGL